jgi:uncharacterized membrane protein
MRKGIAKDTTWVVAVAFSLVGLIVYVVSLIFKLDIESNMNAYKTLVITLVPLYGPMALGVSVGGIVKKCKGGEQ